MPQTQPLGSDAPIPLHVSQSSGGDTKTAAEMVTGAVGKDPGFDLKRGLSDDSSIVLGDVPPTASLDVPRPMATFTPPDLPLDVPSVDSPSAPAHVPRTVQLDVSSTVPSTPAPVLSFDPPSSNVTSTGPSHIQPVVLSGVPPSVTPHGPDLTPVWPTTQSNIQSTVPSSCGAPRPRPNPASPIVSLVDLSAVQGVVSPAVLPTVPMSGSSTTATSTDTYPRIALEGAGNLIPAKQPSFDSLSGQPSDTLWSFPRNYTPTFSSSGFAATPSEALNNNSWNVQACDGIGAEANGDWTMITGETGLEPSSPSRSSDVDAWDLAGSRLSAGPDAFEEMGFGNDLKAVGRTSEASLSIIKEEFIEVQKRAKAVAEKTGLSTAQILQYWSTISTRTHSKRNAWNLYSSYFREHEEEELSRLSERKSIALVRDVCELTQFFCSCQE